MGEDPATYLFVCKIDNSTMFVLILYITFLDINISQWIIYLQEINLLIITNSLEVNSVKLQSIVVSFHHLVEIIDKTS